MLRSGENETEILLGNKQLLGIFFLVAALLGVAFTGGYMLGRGGAGKKPVSAVAANTPLDASGATPETGSGAASEGGETHSLAPAEAPALDTDSAKTAAQPASAAGSAPLGARRHKDSSIDAEAPGPAPVKAVPAKADDFNPQAGEEFLQVTSVARDHANAVAAVLRHKGFRAHAVPKPGNPKLYRVIVGPIRDAGELASTRDSLRKTGFRDVIVQHYQ